MRARARAPGLQIISQLENMSSSHRAARRSRSRSPRRSAPREEVRLCRAASLKLKAPWAEAMAAGRKWFECQASATTAQNRFKSFGPGDYVIFGTSGDPEAAGIFRVAAPATRGLALKDDPDAVMQEHLLPRLAADGTLIEALRSYLDGKSVLDYLPFDEVWDLRPLRITCSDLVERLGADCKKHVASTVFLVPRPDADLCANMAAFLEEHRDRVIRRQRRRPKWKASMWKGGVEV